MKRVVVVSSKRSGKTIAMEKARDDYVRKNPKATIVTVRDGETIVEKSVEDLGPKLLSHQQDSSSAKDSEP